MMKVIWCGVCVVVVLLDRLSVVTVLQGVHYPGLAAPTTSTVAPPHHSTPHHTTATLLLQLDNIKLNIRTIVGLAFSKGIIINQCLVIST